jgi:alkanesulfonate monooxygenase SsuD/methylene tetrahydromethanopterin reductase-like flavin-dependent oxidoreductase (luciferase family)
VTAVLLNAARRWDAPDAVDVAGPALAGGVDGIGLVDSPRLFRDAFVETERVLTATTAALAGPCVASLGLRHPATVAGAVRTLEGHHPGRVLTVVGRGESSVRNEGLPVPPLGGYLASLERLRDGLATGDGAPVAPGRVLGAASGPRTIAATAGVLGGVLVDVGVEPGVVRRAAELARERDPAATVWLFLRATVTGSEQEAFAAAEPIIGSCAMRMAAAPDWYGVDPADLGDVRAVAESHDYRRHGTAGARGGSTGSADALVRERFVLTGDPDGITARLRPLAGLGVTGVVLAGAVHGVEDCLRVLVPALRAGLQAPERDR